MEENTKPVSESTEMDINSDSDIPGNTHLTNPEGELEPAELAQKEIDELKDKYIRLAAEFDNFKRRNAKERLELINTAGKEVIVALLEVLDDMDRAEKTMTTVEDAAQIKIGNGLVYNKLRNTLQQKGLKVMESIGTDFDTEKHEAITSLEAGPDNKGKVVDELEKGYYLNDKLIRFAKVVVGK